MVGTVEFKQLGYLHKNPMYSVKVDNMGLDLGRILTDESGDYWFWSFVVNNRIRVEYLQQIVQFVNSLKPL